MYNARNLAVSTYGSPQNPAGTRSGSKAPCGYGIAIPQGSNGATSLSVFSYVPVNQTAPCPVDQTGLTNDMVATSSLPGQPDISLDGVFVTANFDRLYFIPPDPRTCADFPSGGLLPAGVLCGDTNNPAGGSALPDLVITITGRKNTGTKACVVVNGFGQITTTCPAS